MASPFETAASLPPQGEGMGLVVPKQILPLVLTLLLSISAPALAVQPDEILADPALEARARDLSQELRCMVCQNQSIDDSDAPLARDLRLLVRERLKAGDSDREVLDFMAVRYGEFVLLRPPFNWHTALLWLLGPLVLLAAGIGLFRFTRRSEVQMAGAIDQPAVPLTETETRRLSELVDEQRPRPAEVFEPHR